MRRSRALVLGGIATLGAFAACTSTANLSGGSDDAGSPDALVEGGGGTDTGGGGTDAGSDVAEPLDGASPCSVDAGQIFCDDFSGPLGAQWDAISRTTGTLALDTSAFVSAPQGLRVTAPPTTTFGEPAYLQKRFAGAFTSFRCTVSFRRDQIGVSAVGILRFEAETTPETIAASLFEQPNDDGTFGLSLTPTDGGNAQSNYIDAPVQFAAGTWHTLTMTVDSNAIQIDVDGTPGGKIQHGVTQPATAVTVFLGLRDQFDNNSQPWSVAYDDLRCFRDP